MCDPYYYIIQCAALVTIMTLFLAQQAVSFGYNRFRSFKRHEFQILKVREYTKILLLICQMVMTKIQCCCGT